MAFFLVFLEQDIELRMDMETEFGIKDDKKVQESSLPK